MSKRIEPIDQLAQDLLMVTRALQRSKRRVSPKRLSRELSCVGVAVRIVFSKRHIYLWNNEQEVTGPWQTETVVSVIAILISSWSAFQSYRSSKQQSRVQERLLYLEEAEENRQSQAAKSAELRVVVDQSRRDPALVVRNDGAAEARNISIKIDGASILKHPIVLHQKEVRQIGPGASVRYKLDLTMGTPSIIKVEIGWDDEAAAAKSWRSELSLF